jgi:general secretion pathway protein D
VAFDSARYSEAANRYEALLTQGAGLLTADQKAHCEMRLNECRARLGAGGATILESTLESRKLAREAAVAEYDSYLADSRKALMSGDADAARSHLAAARLRIRSAAQFFAQSENEAFENSLERMKSQIDTAAVAIENRTREEQARQQKRDAELAQEEAANARANKIADAIDRTRALQSEQKYAEALQVVDEILFLDPINPTGLLLREALTDLDIMQRYTELRRKKRVSAANYRLDAEEATIVGPDVMNFADDWPKLSARRGEPIAFADAEDNRRTLALLESRKQPAVIENSTLEEALAFIKQIASVEMDVDWSSLENVGINKETPVSLTLSKVSAKVLLDKVLERASEDPTAGAAWTIKEGMIFIASKEDINRDRVLAIYDIKDLLVVIPDFEEAPEFNLQSVLQSGQGGGGQSPFQDQGGNQQEDEDALSPEELTDQLVEIIQKSVDSEGWEDNGGETGYIQRFQGNLIVTQTPANHREIRNLLSKLREQRSMQVNVEARFLLVSQSFFEQIGFDLDVYWNGRNNQVRSARAGAPTQQIRPSDFFDFTNGGLQRRVQGSVPGGSGGPATGTTQSVILPSPLSVIGTPANSLGLTELLTQGEFASTILGEAPALGIGGQFLDDIQVDFLVKATQADRRTVTLTAPRLTFTNGQSSWVAVATQVGFVSDLTPVVSESAVGFDPQLQVVSEGVVLSVDGTISADRRYVFLTVETAVSKIEGFNNIGITAVAGGQLVNSADTQSFIQTPTVTVTEVNTSVTVPDQGTLLLGGQRLITEGEVETGVPVLSKLPLIKRFFTNRTETKEEQTLLILIKPTILIQTEEEERHFPGISQLQGASGG